MLLNLPPNLNPNSVSCDYELAAFQSVSARFPNTSIDGCFFHFVKNFKKCLRNNNLLGLYNNAPNFALQARMIPAMAFVPIPQLDIAFAALGQILPAQLQPILEWLEDNYMGRRVGNNNNRRPPSFPIPMWNVNNRVQQHLERTNNYAEAAHRRIMAELQTDHPTIWKLITDLKKVQKGRDAFHENLVAGNAAPKKQQRYIQCDARIERLVGNFVNYVNITDFLRDLAHNFEMN